MRKSEFDGIFNERLQALKALRDAKHGEYADDEETFRNLKDGGEKLGIDPMLYAFHLMTKQYNSIHDYVKEWDATGECRQADLDRAWEKIQDVIVYNLLIYGMWLERVRDNKVVALDERRKDVAGGSKEPPSPFAPGIPRRNFQSVETPPRRTGVLFSDRISEPKEVKGVRRGEIRIQFNPERANPKEVVKMITDALDKGGFKPLGDLLAEPKKKGPGQGFFGFLKGLVS